MVVQTPLTRPRSVPEEPSEKAPSRPGIAPNSPQKPTWSPAFARLSPPLRLGLLVFLAGAGLDLIYHVPWLTGPLALDAYLGENGYWAHLVTFLGMAVIVLGVVAAGLTQTARRYGLPGKLTSSR